MSLDKLHKGVQEITRKNMGKGKHGTMTDTFHSRKNSISFGYNNEIATADGHKMKESIGGKIIGEVKTGARKIKAQRKLEGRLYKDANTRLATTPLRALQGLSKE